MAAGYQVPPLSNRKKALIPQREANGHVIETFIKTEVLLFFDCIVREQTFSNDNHCEL